MNIKFAIDNYSFKVIPTHLFFSYVDCLLLFIDYSCIGVILKMNYNYSFSCLHSQHSTDLINNLVVMYKSCQAQSAYGAFVT